MRVRDHFDHAAAEDRIAWAEYAMSGRLPNTPLHPQATEREAITARQKVRNDQLYNDTLCPMGHSEIGQYRRSVASRLPIWG